MHDVGDVASLEAQFYDTNGNLANPTTVTVELEHGDGSRTGPLTPTNPSVGVFRHDVALTIPGLLIWRFIGTGANAGVVEGDLNVAAAFQRPLLSLEEYKAAAGDTSTDKDERLRLAIAWASHAIRDHLRHEFEPPAAGTRQFRYNDSGFVEIDGCAAITAVRLDGRALTTSEWIAEPVAADVFTWLELLPYGESPEMGFTRNLDRLFPYQGRPRIVEVDATFGWPSVPSTVKQAAVWTTAAFAANPGGYISEAIQGYSRTIANPAAREAIPDRALDLLEPYRRRSLGG